MNFASEPLVVAAVQVVYRVGDLVPGDSYRVRENGRPIVTRVANAAGEITFTASPGTTAIVSYGVR